MFKKSYLEKFQDKSDDYREIVTTTRGTKFEAFEVVISQRGGTLRPAGDYR